MEIILFHYSHKNFIVNLYICLASFSDVIDWVLILIEFKIYI